MTDLSVRLGPLTLKNPLVAASGTFGFGCDYGDILPPETFGAVIVKGTSMQPWSGNPPPRIFETPSGMLNAIGLENPGVREVMEVHLPSLLRRDTAVIVNVVGRTVDEYAAVARELSAVAGLAALELNISCPNVAAGGMGFGTCPDTAARLVSSVREVTDLPLLVKLTPNVTDIAALARSVERAGADVISLINTLAGMEIDVESERPVLGNVFGGLSGPAIRPVALRCVWNVYDAVGIPLLGLGGVCSHRDVLAFMLAGASAVGMGTALFSDPSLPGRILRQLSEYRRSGRDWPVGRAHEEGERDEGGRSHHCRP
ncbi:MAG: dihydroorotate dehydrogenase [Bacillota bacterium]